MPTKPRADTPPAGEGRAFLGLDRRRRFRIYRWSVLALLLGFVIWSISYLRPGRWRKYTDGVAFEQVAKDVDPGRVTWDKGAPAPLGDGIPAAARDAAIAVDGSHMAYSTGYENGNADLFLCRWAGDRWGTPRRLRALGSAFHETAPAFSPDGKFLFFATDRPGGPGGFDIWVAKWDGLEFAWPLPLTDRVNTPYDEVDPALSPDGAKLYLASDRPYVSEVEAIRAADSGEAALGVSNGFDIYSADLAGDTPFELVVERQLSMLYSLRQGALSAEDVMRKLGGSQKTEAAVDHGLAYLAATQEEDGRWDLRKNGGQGGHDVAATSFALLAFYGRGERHDIECQYKAIVERGLVWLLSQQNRATGDLRGNRPQQNAMYDHGIASLALVEAYGVTKDPDLRARAIAAVEFITDSQHEGGGWRYRPGDRGDLSVTGWYIMALASAQMSGIPVPEGTMQRAEKFLRFVSGGEHGGSYGYTDPPGRRGSNRHAMDAVGFFCSQLVGASPNAAPAWESSRFVGKHGVRVSDLYYLYYGTLAAYQHQGPLWRAWREKMQQGLLRQQARDGSWRAGGNHGSQMGKTIGTALTLLCLEAHYRYTPLYGLGYEPPEQPSDAALPLTSLPPTPLFRHAKYLEGLNSPADDAGPCPTDHGDFLYFASDRADGLGGSDLYRARLASLEPTQPENLGPAINSSSDESSPALHKAGFGLVYDAGSEDATTLHAAASLRLHKAARFRLPDFAWFGRQLPVLLLLAAAGTAAFVWTRRTLRATPSEPAPAPEAAAAEPQPADPA